MEYRTLGRTNLKVSALCLGTMTWGLQNTEAEGHGQMDYALSRGINFFDTAEMYSVPPSAETYGRTEEIIGSWFAARGGRDKVILASKMTGPGMSWIRGGSAITRATIQEAVDASLRRLKTDYIDLYQFHWPNRPNYHHGKYWKFSPVNVDAQAEEAGILEILQTLDELIKAGKIRHAGLSNDSAWGVMKYVHLSERHGLPRIVSVQNEYSLLCRLFEGDLSEVALFEDVGLLAWSPLGYGALTGKYLDGARPEGSRWAIDHRKLHRDTPQTNEAVKAYRAVADRHGLDACQMALAFVTGQPFVTSTIIGATTMEQLKTNIDSIDLMLDNSVKQEIEAVRRQYPVPY